MKFEFLGKSFFQLGLTNCETHANFLKKIGTVTFILYKFYSFHQAVKRVIVRIKNDRKCSFSDNDGSTQQSAGTAFALLNLT